MEPMETGPRTTLRRPGKLPWVIGGVAVAAAVVALVVWWVGRQAPAVPDLQPVAGSGPAEIGAGAPAQEPPALATASDADVRGLLEPASQDPLYRQWLASGDLLRKAAVVADNLGEGVSPRRELAFLAPSKAFSVVQRDGKTVIDPGAYARYDAFGDAVASVDPRALGSAYRSLKRVLEGAYRKLGYPQASIDAVVGRALRRIERAPVRDGDLAVVDEGGVYLYEDPALERLPEAEKHLLRMGPRNTRLLQAKARELREAMGLGADGGAAPGR
ncbi:MAG: DUF3014 domain-containing protein [Anaeromyxobacter sp.]